MQTSGITYVRGTRLRIDIPVRDDTSGTTALNSSKNAFLYIPRNNAIINVDKDNRKRF